MAKLSSAQKRWLDKLAHAPAGEIHWPRPTYDMAGRMRDSGYVEIIDKPGSVGWPWGTSWYIRITPAGREALS